MTFGNIPLLLNGNTSCAQEMLDQHEPWELENLEQDFFPLNESNKREKGNISFK